MLLRRLFSARHRFYCYVSSPIGYLTLSIEMYFAFDLELMLQIKSETAKASHSIRPIRAELFCTNLWWIRIWRMKWKFYFFDFKEGNEIYCGLFYDLRSTLVDCLIFSSGLYGNAVANWLIGKRHRRRWLADSESFDSYAEAEKLINAIEMIAQSIVSR